MSISLQRYTAGDTDYISKMNTDAVALEQAINAIQASLGGSGGVSPTLFLAALFKNTTTLIGTGSYIPVGSSTNLTVSAGAVYKASSQTIVQSLAPVVLAFSGQTAGLYYVVPDVTGTPARQVSSADAVYSVVWTGSAFGTITKVAPALFDAVEENDARSSARLGDFTTLDARLEAEENATADAANDAENALSLAYSAIAGVSGDVSGPGSSTDNAIARFDSTTGKIIQTGAPIIQDDGRISTVTDPTSAQDAATKNYVDGLAANLGKRARVRASTTANITIATALNNGDTLDGVTLSTGDLVLVKDQSTTNQNGVYVVGVSPARDTQFDTYDEHPGSLIAVEEGTINADTLWLCTSNVGGTLNTTAIVFAALSIVAGLNQLTGDVTAGPGSGSQAATISSHAVTNAKAAQMAAHTIKGNNTGSTADSLDLTATQVTAELNAVVGDSGSGGTKGLVPAPGSGDAAAGKFLKADGTFSIPKVVRKVCITIDGGGSVITTGIRGAIQVDFAGTIIGWSLIADQSGSISVEIDKHSSSAPNAAPSIPNTSTDKISASAPVAVSSAQSAAGGTSEVSTWTTSVAQWDVIQFNVASVTTITRAVLYLRIQES